MKRIIGTVCSVAIVLSLCSAAFASNSVAPSGIKIIKQIVLSDEEPAPTSVPATEPAPAPEPTAPEPK